MVYNKRRNLNMYSDNQKYKFASQGLNVNLIKCHNFVIFLSIFKIISYSFINNLYFHL